MKKLLIAIIFLLLSCFTVISNAVATNSSDLSKAKVYVFYENDSEIYKKEKNWIDENGMIRVEYININENKTLTDKVKNSFEITDNNLPLTIIGTKFYIGFDDNIKSNISETITYYENSNDYIDVISELRDNKEVKNIVKKEEKIKKKKDFTGIWKIVLIIVIILIIIFIRKMNIRKKRLKRFRHKY